ncbi:hypothetical protein EDC61_12019 [Sulfuritortus calidifontis]|uniref:Uncharacterized protein n=1 Tax=Sulfuritortus calidifontis TaxID=1914471 RepID=A0A4R3JTW2_9PROT|nr:hypothetical protein [Sulfuritortus calidifontis]TCS69458.1 hypothetical protein EDC61_12019 [Sulfuritortus calidifontis]
MALSRRQLLLAAPWLVIGLIVALLAAWQMRAPEPARVVSCPDLRAGCSLPLDGATVGVEGELRVLKPFQLWLKAPGARRVQAHFTMAGMDMGFNLYTLRPDADGVFRARIVLPVCVSGRRDWVMSLEIDGRRIELPFVTELS